VTEVLTRDVHVASGRKRRHRPITDRRGGVIAIRVLVFGAFAGVWQLLAVRSDSLLIPTFTETVGALFQLMFQDGELWGPLWESNKAVVIGFPLAVVTAIPIGLAMARWAYFGRFMNPWAILLLALPIAPLTPLLILGFGIGMTSRVIVVVLFCWVFIALNTRAGVRGVDPSLIEMARAFDANERQVWRFILLRGAMPGIIAGLRIGLARAIAGMVVVELLMVPAGVGGLMLRFRGQFEAGLVFAVVLAVILESVLILFGMRALERRLVPWANAAQV
jgi:NitT/TauT family transport system permease protein